MNHSPSAQYTEPYRPITRYGDNLEQVILDSIQTAQVSIDLAVQEFRLPNVAKALVARKQAGLSVRVIIENTYNNTLTDNQPLSDEEDAQDEREQERYEEALRLVDLNGDGQVSPQELNERDALVILRNGGVSLIDDTADGSRGSGLMHHKFVVIDGRQVVTGSANFTTSDIHGDFTNPDTTGNANNLLVIDSTDLAALFVEEFNRMWGDGPGGQLNSEFGVQKQPFRLPQDVRIGDTRLEVMFSPVNRKTPYENSTNGVIIRALQTARQQVDLALFVFSEQAIADALEVDHNRGVAVRALIDPGFAFRDYSEGLDLLGVISPRKNCKVEKDNHAWTRPVKTVGIPNLARGDKLHHKFGLVDAQTVITGSHNWSPTANFTNDETLLVIHNNPTVAAHYAREFDRLFADAFLGVPPKTQKKIDEQRQLCQL
jgi:phosphatidylserine/phosphatidylglycerophosphate/cardiolipin synthase-like enzyme